MCGIVGYIGSKEAFPILIKGLQRLEYRGYDSAGVALVNSSKDLQVYKAKGKVQDLLNFCDNKDVSGTIGIAHTRWATHGEPSSRNAHPHYSQSRNLALIHNGIIENYLSIKKFLEENGFEFQSDTDTEVLVQLIEYMKQKNDCDLFEAVRLALTQVEGAYAIGVLEKGNADVLIAARKGSPLVVGVGEGEFFLGSDAAPMVDHTKNVVYPDDKTILKLERGKDLIAINFDKEQLDIQLQELQFKLEEIEKGSKTHFMLIVIFV